MPSKKTVSAPTSYAELVSQKEREILEISEKRKSSAAELAQLEAELAAYSDEQMTSLPHSQFMATLESRRKLQTSLSEKRQIIAEENSLLDKKTAQLQSEITNLRDKARLDELNAIIPGNESRVQELIERVNRISESLVQPLQELAQIGVETNALMLEKQTLEDGLYGRTTAVRQQLLAVFDWVNLPKVTLCDNGVHRWHINNATEVGLFPQKSIPSP